MQRRRYQFFGTVQGVGFRYRAHYAAQHLDLTGWVANQYDGSVLLEVQGQPAALDRVVDTICGSSRYIHLERVEVQTVPVKPEERGFRVQYGHEYAY